MYRYRAAGAAKKGCYVQLYIQVAENLINFATFTFYECHPKELSPTARLKKRKISRWPANIKSKRFIMMQRKVTIATTSSAAILVTDLTI